MVLIGMAGAGKSTVGQALARRLALEFVDTDEWLMQLEGRSLQALLEGEGVAGYKAAEERAILTLRANSRAIIATGGSVIYSSLAMASLRSLGLVIYLRASFATVTQRVDNWQARGFVADKGKSLQDIYNERAPLYECAADAIIDVDKLSVESIVNTIVNDFC